MGKPVEEVSLHGWRGYRLAGGDVAVVVTPDIGGRIMSLTHRGEELLFVHHEQVGETYDFSKITDLRAEKRRLGFRLWGGDKTWVAPQSEWWEAIPPLDLDAAKYAFRLENNAVVMESPVCWETGLRICRRVEVKDNGEVILDQIFKNMSDTPVRRGIWDVTQCLRPFDVYIPIKAPALRPYPEEGDSVELYKTIVTEENGWAKITCEAPAHFKYGGLAERGVVLALRHSSDNTMAYVRTFQVNSQLNYAHGSSVEVYNSPNFNYLEIEVHAPLTTLQPGESVSHRQSWRVAGFPASTGHKEVADALFG